MDRPLPENCPTKRNQRAAPRRIPKGSTKAIAYKNWLGVGSNIALAVLDVSESGIRLMLKDNMSVGQQFEVSLHGIGSKMVKMIAEVVWSVKAADGTFIVGAKFQKPLTYSDLHLFARL